MKEEILADVSKCANEIGPLKSDCKRYTAVSARPERQVYSLFKFRLTGDKPSCEHFLGNQRYFQRLAAKA